MGRDVAPAPRVGVIPPGTAHPLGLLDDGEAADAGPDELHAHGQAGQTAADDDDTRDGPACGPGGRGLPRQSPAPNVQRHVRSVPFLRPQRPARPAVGHLIQADPMVGLLGTWHDTGSVGPDVPSSMTATPCGRRVTVIRLLGRDRGAVRTTRAGRLATDGPVIPSGPGEGQLRAGAPHPAPARGPAARGGGRARGGVRRHRVARSSREAPGASAGSGPRCGPHRLVCSTGCPARCSTTRPSSTTWRASRCSSSRQSPLDHGGRGWAAGGLGRGCGRINTRGRPGPGPRHRRGGGPGGLHRARVLRLVQHRLVPGRASCTTGRSPWTGPRSGG